MGKYLDYNGVKYLWQKIFHRLIPSGGSSGQVLAKASGTDYDVEWVAPGGGGGTTDTWYGTCSTAAGTRAKVVTCTGFTRRTGSIVTVYHSTACTVATTSSAAVTLNVNSTGAAAIAMRNGTTLRTTAANSGYSFYWHAGDYITYMFDGTYWVVISVGKSLNAPEYRSYSKTSGNVASSAGSVTITQTLDYGYDLLAVADPRTNGWVGSPYVGSFSFTRSTRSASATVWWTHNGSGTVSVDFIARWIGMVQN